MDDVSNRKEEARTNVVLYYSTLLLLLQHPRSDYFFIIFGDGGERGARRERVRVFFRLFATVCQQQQRGSSALCVIAYCKQHSLL